MFCVGADALPGLVPDINPLTQDFVSLHPVLLYYGALPLDPPGFSALARHPQN